MATEKQTADCGCVEKIESEIAQPMGYTIIREFIVTGGGDMKPSPPSIRIGRLKGAKSTRNRMPVVFCAFCPVCGRKYAK